MGGRSDYLAVPASAELTPIYAAWEWAKAEEEHRRAIALNAVRAAPGEIPATPVSSAAWPPALNSGSALLTFFLICNTT